MQAFAEEFDRLCIERHEMGAKQYGPVAFLKNNMVEFMAEELADLCNYAKYTYIKLRLFQEMYEDSPDSTHKLPRIGVEDWIPSNARTAPTAAGLRDLLRTDPRVQDPGQRGS
jgi:hypothetical protein